MFNERFFQQFGIKSNKIFPLFFTFNLFRNGYVLREHDRWGDFIDYKILENENDYKNADVRYKHEFKNIIDSYYLNQTSHHNSSTIQPHHLLNQIYPCPNLRKTVHPLTISQ